LEYPIKIGEKVMLSLEALIELLNLRVCEAYIVASLNWIIIHLELIKIL